MELITNMHDELLRQPIANKKPAEVLIATEKWLSFSAAEVRYQDHQRNGHPTDLLRNYRLIIRLKEKPYVWMPQRLSDDLHIATSFVLGFRRK